MQPDKSNHAQIPKRSMDMVTIRPVPANSTTPSYRNVSRTDKKWGTSPKLEPTNDSERPSMAFLLIVIVILVFAGVGVCGAYYFFKYKPNHSRVVAPKLVKQTNNTESHITNDTLGIKFAINKGLLAIGQADLLKQNPYFVYGFKAKDVDKVSCIISQQKRDKPGGPVNPESLRDGTVGNIKKSFASTKLVDYQDISLVNDQDAADMVITYNDGKIDVKEHMLVAATNTHVTFTFCYAPKPLYDFYKPKFDTLFNSLEIY